MLTALNNHKNNNDKISLDSSRQNPARTSLALAELSECNLAFSSNPSLFPGFLSSETCQSVLNCLVISDLDKHPVGN